MNEELKAIHKNLSEIKYKHIDEALAHLNQGNYGLARDLMKMASDYILFGAMNRLYQLSKHEADNSRSEVE